MPFSKGVDADLAFDMLYLANKRSIYPGWLKKGIEAKEATRPEILNKTIPLVFLSFNLKTIKKPSLVDQ